MNLSKLNLIGLIFDKIRNILNAMYTNTILSFILNIKGDREYE